MAVLKGFCAKCKKNGEGDRIFDINPNADFCYCPKCMSKYTIEEANDNYKKLISKKMNAANRAFYRTRDYAASYVLYGAIIEIDPNHVDAHLGRMLSLLLLSGVRRSRFKEVSELLTNEVDLFLENKRTDAIYKFAKHIFLNLDTYMNRLYKRLTLNSRFYDANCLSLFFENIRDALILVNNLTSILKKIESKNNTTDITLNKRFDDAISKLKGKLNTRYALVDGSIYELVEFHEQEKAIIAKVSKCRSNFVIKSALATLDVNDKKKIPIKEQIFKCYKNKIILGKCLFAGAVVFLAGGIFCVIASLVFLLVSAFANSNQFLIFIIMGGVLIFLALAMAIVAIMIQVKIRKHYKKYINL